MARTEVTPTSVGASGIDPAGVAVAAQLTDGNSFPWSPRRRLFVANNDAVDLTLTVQTPATVGAGALAVDDAEFTVTAGATLLLRPLGTEFRRTDGDVWLDYAGATASVSVAVLDEG